MTKTRVGIFGYGNLGRGVELACRQNDDLELVALFTRRDPATVKPLTEGVPVFAAADMEAHQADVDGRARPVRRQRERPAEQTPACASMFNVVDSFDTRISSRPFCRSWTPPVEVGGKVAVISAGWDPGMFLHRAPVRIQRAARGRGLHVLGRVFAGHSDAIRRIEGVADARQYTRARRLGARSRAQRREAAADHASHTRECFVVAERAPTLAAIEKAIVEMRNFFADYDTTVTFISQEEL